MAAETKVQPPTGRDQAGGQVLEFLDDGFEPLALGRVPNRGLVAEQDTEKGTGYFWPTK